MKPDREIFELVSNRFFELEGCPDTPVDTRLVQYAHVGDSESRDYWGALKAGCGASFLLKPCIECEDKSLQECKDPEYTPCCSDSFTSWAYSDSHPSHPFGKVPSRHIVTSLSELAERLKLQNRVVSRNCAQQANNWARCYCTNLSPFPPTLCIAFSVNSSVFYFLYKEHKNEKILLQFLWTMPLAQTSRPLCPSPTVIFAQSHLWLVAFHSLTLFFIHSILQTFHFWTIAHISTYIYIHTGHTVLNKRIIFLASMQFLLYRRANPRRTVFGSLHAPFCRNVCFSSLTVLTLLKLLFTCYFFGAN